ncbi:MAG: thioredoxin family protein [Capsulimonadaceae bacterium]
MRVGWLLFATAVALNMAVGAQAQEMEWRSSLDAAQAESRSTGKLMMIDIYATWCYWCKSMDDHTYLDSSVVLESENFIPVRVDSDHEGHDLAAQFNVTGLPTLLIVDSNWHEQACIVGYISAANLVNALKEVDTDWWSSHPSASTSPMPQQARRPTAYTVPAGSFNKMPEDKDIPVGDMSSTFADPYATLTVSQGIALANACVRKHDYARAGKVARSMTKAGKSAWLGRLYNMLGDAAQVAGTPDAAWGWYDLTIQHSTDPACLSHAYLQIGEYDTTTDNIDAARTSYQALIDLAAAPSDVRDRARVLLTQLDSGAQTP